MSALSLRASSRSGLAAAFLAVRFLEVAFLTGLVSADSSVADSTTDSSVGSSSVGSSSVGSTSAGVLAAFLALDRVRRGATSGAWKSGTGEAKAGTSGVSVAAVPASTSAASSSSTSTELAFLLVFFAAVFLAVVFLAAGAFAATFRVVFFTTGAAAWTSTWTSTSPADEALSGSGSRESCRESGCFAALLRAALDRVRVVFFTVGGAGVSTGSTGVSCALGAGITALPAASAAAAVRAVVVLRGAALRVVLFTTGGGGVLAAEAGESADSGALVVSFGLSSSISALLVGRPDQLRGPCRRREARRGRRTQSLHVAATLSACASPDARRPPFRGRWAVGVHHCHWCTGPRRGTGVDLHLACRTLRGYGENVVGSSWMASHPRRTL